MPPAWKQEESKATLVISKKWNLQYGYGSWDSGHVVSSVNPEACWEEVGVGGGRWPVRAILNAEPLRTDHEGPRVWQSSDKVLWAGIPHVAWAPPETFLKAATFSSLGNRPWESATRWKQKAAKAMFQGLETRGWKPEKKAGNSCWLKSILLWFRCS